MSRSKKGKKGPGYEYWTARPGNKHGALPGAFTKKRTHRWERAEAKEAVAEGQIVEPFDWQEDECHGCHLCMCVKCGGYIVVESDTGLLTCRDCKHNPEEEDEEPGT